MLQSCKPPWPRAWLQLGAAAWKKTQPCCLDTCTCRWERQPMRCAAWLPPPQRCMPHTRPLTPLGTPWLHGWPPTRGNTAGKHPRWGSSASALSPRWQRQRRRTRQMAMYPFHHPRGGPAPTTSWPASWLSSTATRPAWTATRGRTGTCERLRGGMRSPAHCVTPPCATHPVLWHLALMTQRHCHRLRITATTAAARSRLHRGWRTPGRPVRRCSPSWCPPTRQRTPAPAAAAT